MTIINHTALPMPSAVPARFGMHDPNGLMQFGVSSRRSKSGSMVDNIDSCTALCIAVLVVTLAITYHVHDLALAEQAKDAKSTTAKRLDKIRMALVILLFLEIAMVAVKMM